MPLTWVENEDPGHVHVVEFQAWLDSLPESLQDDVLGEVDDLFDAAARGDLWDSGDNFTRIKPVTDDPEVFELRWRVKVPRPRDGEKYKYLRFYHGEPVRFPTKLVRLHRHIKTSDEQQEVAIQQAVHRYKKP